MQHITHETSIVRTTKGPAIVTYSITEPGLKPILRFEEEGMEIVAGTLACDYGCKIYKYKDGETRVLWHSTSYGCPRG